jgi:CIC family chloride channel protein
LKDDQYSFPGIPLAPSLHITSDDAEFKQKEAPVRRTMVITLLACINAIFIGFIAKGLVLLIRLCTSFFFFGRLTTADLSPAANHLGLWVIAIPVMGGIIVGLMARYGSKGIRGHGIPEAMEKILTDESKIPPLITFLKPLSAAISIGTGGPFGAEGPIIATGGAFGSVCGQTLHTTAHERKVLLAAGATAGMTAIFGSPFAAILLAIELLLFEFSPKSFVPVVVACVTAACCHFLLFGTAPTFPMPQVAMPDRNAIVAYALIGILIGLASVVVTKSVYLIEDAFEKLPVHWMWWPAIGGLAVGIIGYFAPLTLGVGYPNITHALSGMLPLAMLTSLCFLKFLSWSIALGSGTSGGTLAPLLTIGSSLGCMLGMLTQILVPEAHVSLPLAALVGMAALFAGSARALLTAIVFALETTMQENTLLPLIAGCVTSYMVSFVLMRGTIMTEKINRRGVITPESFHPDILQTTLVSDVIKNEPETIAVFDADNTVEDVRKWLASTQYNYNTLLILDSSSSIAGAIGKEAILSSDRRPGEKIGNLPAAKVYSIYPDNNLQLAVHFLIKTKQDILPVVERNTQKIIGAIASAHILIAYEMGARSDTHRHQNISARQNVLKVISKGRQLFAG